MTCGLSDNPGASRLHFQPTAASVNSPVTMFHTLWVDEGPSLRGCLPILCGSRRATISAHQTVLIGCQEAGTETPVSVLILLSSWQRGAWGTASHHWHCGRRPCWHNTLSPRAGDAWPLSKNNLGSWQGGMASGRPSANGCGRSGWERLFLLATTWRRQCGQRG